MEDLDPILQQIIYGSPGQLTSPAPPPPPTAYQLMLELAEEINENVESKDKKDDYWQDIKDVKSVNIADTVTDTDQRFFNLGIQQKKTYGAFFLGSGNTTC